jgi:outer membrane murein-binding lipoprotein Lpp
MAEAWMTLDSATKALAATADRAALLMREDSERARIEASRAWDQIELMRSDILEARKETQKARATGRRAWFTVGIMAGMMIAAVGYTSSALTRHYLEVNQLSTQVDQWKSTADHRQVELQQLREETQRALIAQARAEAELGATTNTNHAQPAINPTLTERVANLFIDTRH